MCSCGANKITFSQSVERVGSILPALKYWHCAYKDQFESLFKNIGIDATEAKLPLLASVYDNGRGDLSGIIKDASGKPIVFDTEKVLGQIDVSKPVNNNCAIA